MKKHSIAEIYIVYCLFINYWFSLQHLLRVVPVIGILNDRKAFKPTPNPAEVDAVFDAPLEMFIKVFFFNSF